MASTEAAVARPEAKRAGLITAGSAMTFVLLVGTSSFFADMTYEGGRSIVGPFLQILGSSAAAVGIAAGAGEFLGYALRFITGYAADKTGAYWRITLIGYAVQLFALPMLAFVGLWQVAVAVWFVERIGKAIKNPARDAMLSYATKELGRGWGYGLHEAMDQAGGFAGPLLMALVLGLRANGGLDTVADYQWAFRLLFVPAIITMLLLFFARFKFPNPRDLESKTPKASTRGLGRRYWLYVAAAGLIGAGFADFALMAFHFKATSLVTDQWIPVLFALGILFNVVTALVAGKLYDKRGFPVIIIAFGLSALFAPFVFLGGLPLVLVGMALWGIGLAAQESLMKAALADLIPTNRRAYGFGAFSLAFGIFWFAGSAVMGLLYDQNITLVVLFSVVVSLLALPVFWLAKNAPDPGMTSA
jgi:MFS family permease